MSKTYDKIIIEKASKCWLVKRGTDVTGHDCWGAYETSDYHYVIIDNIKERISRETMYIIHDDKKAIDTGYITHLPDDLRVLMDEEMMQKQKEERYQRYLKLKKEFENDPVYKLDQKILNITN